jgi:uncharacterized membrane protein
MDKLQHANQLLQWREQRQLSSEQLQQASGQFPLQPATGFWLAQANLILLFGTVVLLGAALIFFLAHNWPFMHYFIKFALAAGALVLSGVIAIRSGTASLVQRAALLSAAILTGALLALIGQTYQTGADIWQLFASWAALITPLVLLSKSRACYLLWFVVLELALGRYLMTPSELFWLLASAPMILSLALANLIIMLFAEFALPRLGVQANQTLVRLSALTLVAPLTLGAGLAAWDHGYQLNLLVYLPLTAVLTLWYWRQRRDVLILALLAFSAITVATAMLASLLESADDFFAMNFLALFVIGASAGTVIWLKKLLPDSSKKNSLSNHSELTTQLQHASIIDAAKAQQLQTVTSPWWLQILLGIAAWIASILIVGSFLGPLLALADNNPVRTAAAVMLLAAAIWLTSRKQEFLQQMAVAIALAGQGLLVYVIYDVSGLNHEIARYACAVISILLLLSPLNQLHQRASLSIALLCLLSLVSSAPLLAVVSSLLALAAALLWCSRVKWVNLAQAKTIKSLLEVTTMAALALTLFGQSLLWLDAGYYRLDHQLDMARALYSALGSVLLISTVFWLSRLATVPSRLALLTITVMLCILLYPASGLLVSTALMLACFYGCSRNWYVLCLLSMLLAISQFYYSLQLNLLHKSGILALSGVTLLAAWLLLQRYQRRLV